MVHWLQQRNKQTNVCCAAAGCWPTGARGVWRSTREILGQFDAIVHSLSCISVSNLSVVVFLVLLLSPLSSVALLFFFFCSHVPFPRGSSQPLPCQLFTKPDTDTHSAPSSSSLTLTSIALLQQRDRPIALPGPSPRALGPATMGIDVEMDTDMDGATPAPAPTTPTASGGLNKLTEPRRRNRPALSCIQCRTRKIRCDRNEPCASCLKSKIVNCTYEEARRPKPRLWRLSPAPTAAGGAAAAASAASHRSDSSPTAEERLAAGSGYTFREVSLAPAPPGQPSAASNPPYATGSATTSTPSGEPTSAPSPAPPRVNVVDLGPGTSAPLGGHGNGHHGIHSANSTAALAERVQQLEQQLADALKRPDHGPHNPHSSYPTPVSSQGAASKVFGAGCLVDGDKLVGLLPISTPIILSPFLDWRAPPYAVHSVRNQESRILCETLSSIFP